MEQNFKKLEKKTFDIDLAFDDKHLRTKIKPYNKKTTRILEMLRRIVLVQLKKYFSASVCQQ